MQRVRRQGAERDTVKYRIKLQRPLIQTRILWVVADDSVAANRRAKSIARGECEAAPDESAGQWDGDFVQDDITVAHSSIIEH